MPEDGDLGFTISSLFPYFQRGKDGKPIYFLPMPMQASLSELADVSMAKKVKRIQWIDSELYSNVLTGARLFDGSDEYVPYIQETYLTKSALPEDPNGWVQVERPDKYSETDDFRDYFIGIGRANLLVIEGVGTDRNVGFGFFEYTSDSLSLNIPEDADHQIALSLLIPESKEQLGELLASDNVAYDFTRRGGWITTYPFTTLRKNAIYGFLPGSVFSKTNEPSHIIGKIVDLRPDIGELTPDHPIWRCGKSIMIPIKLK